MKRLWPIFPALMLVLPLMYYRAEVLDTAPILRQILILPVFLWLFLTNLFGPSAANLLDVDVPGPTASLLRTVSFAVLVFIVLLPWWAWLSARKKAVLLTGIAVAGVYVIFSLGFFVLGVMATSGMGD